VDEHDEHETVTADDGRADTLVAGQTEISLAPGARLVVLAGLGCRRERTGSAIARSNELARRFESITGPCVVVLAGDTFDLEADAQPDPAPVLDTHQRLTDALAAIAGRADSSVVLIPGTRDAALAWHRHAIATVERRLGARLALAVEALIVTGSDRHRVRIEAGTTAGANAPGETIRIGSPSGLGAGTRPDRDWLHGIDLLGDPAFETAFVASRLFYRRVVPRFGWSVVPLLGSIVLLLVGRILRAARRAPAAHTVDAWAAGLAIGGIAVAVASAVWAAAIWWWTDRERLQRPTGWAAREAVDDGEAGDVARSAAARLVAGGHSGLVVGASGDAELADVGSGFYANPGVWGPVAARRPGRFGAPDAWAIEERWSWLDVEAGAELSVELHGARRPLPTTTFVERLLTRSAPVAAGRSAVLAAWPEGTDWPVTRADGAHQRRARRIAALLIAGAGLMNLVSAVLPPLRARVTALEEIVPLAVSQAAAAVVGLSGLLLLLVARGVRRGQRHAWAIAEVVLGLSFALHVVKGLDFEEALLAGAAGLYLYANRRQFRVRADEVAVGRGLAVLAVGACAAVAAATVTIEVVAGRTHHLGWPTAVQAATERLVGIAGIPVGGRLDQFLVPVLVAVSLGLVVYSGWLLFSPVVAKRLAPPEPGDADRARGIVRGANGGTLAYFALRDDKRWFFWRDSLVAYAVSQGVALVSPDPIGPTVERQQVWRAFRQFADDHGWPIAVMGASEEWLPIYRAAGMRDLYVGDEAVVDPRRFTLAGPRNKAIRQAFNRVANKGYTMSFEDPANLDPGLEAALRSLMTESRRGETERGFSMTLGRVFDRNDTGLLLAVCRDRDGRPVAFCQFVPAPGIGGYSLDLMRRSESGDHPNGLTDFVIASTILHLGEVGAAGLALNFATMRGVLADERGDGTRRRMERWISRRMSSSMQIESLWGYNAKFDPDWVPRYACYDAAEHLVAAASALAKAESWWEIPLIGRFFKPAEVAAETAGAGRLR
jgi:lysylphosphatidylglycerol synthetase-like protein (DUF2156 family)